MKDAFRVIVQVCLVTWFMGSLMYWSWDPEQQDSYGFFLFWAWIFAMFFVGLGEKIRNERENL